MKKFVFSLHVLEHYKETLEKKQKAELSKIMARIKALQEEKAAIVLSMDNTAASLERVLRENRNIVKEMERHNLYLQFLQERLQAQEQKIARAEEEKREIQRQLIITIKELKALARLREAEYAAYLDEIRKDEEKVLNDLISHKSAVGEE